MNKLMIVVIVAVTLLLGACVNPSAVRTDYCSPWSAIYVSKNDVLTDSTAKQIMKHDHIGAKLCHWKAHDTDKDK